MPAALVRPDFHLAANVRRNFPAKVTFDLVICLDPVAQCDQLLIGQLVDADVATDLSSLQRLQGAGLADAVDVGKGDLEPLLSRQVDPNQTCHSAVTFRLVGGVWRDASPAAVDSVPNSFGAKSPGPRPPTEGGFEITSEPAVTLFWMKLWVLLISPAAACGEGFRKSPSRDRAGGSPCTCHKSS